MIHDDGNPVGIFQSPEIGEIANIILLGLPLSATPEEVNAAISSKLEEFERIENTNTGDEVPDDRQGSDSTIDEKVNAILGLSRQTPKNVVDQNIFGKVSRLSSMLEELDSPPGRFNEFDPNSAFYLLPKTPPPKHGMNL